MDSRCGIITAVATETSSAEVVLSLESEEVDLESDKSISGSNRGCGPWSSSSSSKEGSFCHGEMGIIMSGLVRVGDGGFSCLIKE